MAEINKDDLTIGVTFTPCSKCNRVEVVYGRWYELAFGELKCSVCGIVQEDNAFPYHYCPCCGAKMDGGNDDV